MSLAFTFQRLSKSFVLQGLQCLLPFTFQRLSMSLVKTSTSFLHFKDYQSLLSCRDFNVFYLYISKTIKVFCLAGTSMSSALYISKTINVFCQDFNVFFTFQRLQCLLSRLQCLLYISKTSMSLVK